MSWWLTAPPFQQGEFEWVGAEIWIHDPLLPWALVSVEPVYGRSRCPPITSFSRTPLTQSECYPAPRLDDYNLSDPEVIRAFDDAAAYWVDFHAFRARCTGAGLDEGFRYRFTTAGEIIDIGLQPGYPKNLGTKLDCHIMAAVQYILHAGQVIYAKCVQRQLPPHREHDWKGWADGKGPETWKNWGNRLREIADALEGGRDPGFTLFEKNREAVKDMVIKARDKMIALEPALFAQSD